MGWSQKSIKPVKIESLPHKQIVSDKELKNLRKYAREDSVDDMIEERVDQENAKREKLEKFRNKDANYAAIVGFLDDFMGENDDVNILDEGFPLMIDNVSKTNGYSFNLDDILDIVYGTMITPMSFYFGIGESKNRPNEFSVFITLGEYWDKNQSFDDRNFETYVLPEWLEECNGEYKFTISPSKIRKQLINYGFIEKHEITN